MDKKNNKFEARVSIRYKAPYTENQQKLCEVVRNSVRRQSCVSTNALIVDNQAVDVWNDLATSSNRRSSISEHKIEVLNGLSENVTLQNQNRIQRVRVNSHSGIKVSPKSNFASDVMPNDDILTENDEDLD